ncbi:DUF6361 family protein [Nocardioides sp. NPDC051685]|uniref:DUF6361 family protein n=1 Tax=Nocardioides sp. NPDC051685 TaxID=3364334 RepID=UPI0037BB9F81
MTSLIAWLDSTPEDQRAAREIVNLFAQRESRDELGIGQIRDALSDVIVPGTSTLHTRARYFLFIPWCYTQGSARGCSGEQLKARGKQQERELISVLKKQTSGEFGLIGVNVGASVKNLPSALYWSGMQQYGIVGRATDSSSIGSLAKQVVEGATELAERRSSQWRLDIPPPPGDNFPTDLTGGFDLTRDEADWLRERITSTSGGSVLAHMVATDHVWDADYPWLQVSARDFPIMEHAELFSGLLNGAALLYNLLIAEEYDADPNLTRLDNMAEEYRTKIDTWHADFLTSTEHRLAAWDTSDFWHVVTDANPNISQQTRTFVNVWLERVRGLSTGSRLYDSAPLRDWVRFREKRKGKQSRLLNPKMRATWSGAAGTGRLDFRWGTVKTIVGDIQRGRGDDAAS